MVDSADWVHAEMSGYMNLQICRMDINEISILSARAEFQVIPNSASDCLQLIQS